MSSLLIQPNDNLQVHVIKSRKSVFANGAFGQVSIALGVMHEHTKQDCFSIQYLAIKKIHNAFRIESKSMEHEESYPCNDPAVATGHTCFYEDPSLHSDREISESSSSSNNNNITEFNNNFVSQKKNDVYNLKKEAFYELSILRLLSKDEEKHCPHITPLLSVLQSDDYDPLSLTLVFPYGLIDLATVIELQRRNISYNNLSCMDKISRHGHIQETFLKTIMNDILSALDFCHSKQIIHRDIKPGNFIITSNGYIQLIDFGLAKAGTSSIDASISLPTQTESMRGDISTGQCTLHYRPPELLFNAQEFGYEVDIWGCGLILAELINLRPLFPGRTVIDQIGKIFYILGTPNYHNSWTDVEKLEDYRKFCFQPQKGIGLLKAIPRIYGNIPIYDLLVQMISLDPRRRPSASICASHAWSQNHPNQCPRSTLVEHLIPVPLRISKTWLDTVPLEDEPDLHVVLDFHKKRAETLAVARQNIAKANMSSSQDNQQSKDTSNLAETIAKASLLHP